MWRCPSDYEGGEPYVVSTLSATGDVRDLNVSAVSSLKGPVFLIPSEKKEEDSLLTF